MKITLYKFFKSYFGDFSTGSAHYARAIVDAEERIHTAFQTKQEELITKYYQEKYPRQLTKNFLNIFWDLANHYYHSPLNQLLYFRNQFIIPNSLLSSRKRLDIISNFCFDTATNRIIFLEYGKLENITQLLPIFRTLSDYKHSLIPIPQINYVSCWDLSKGTIINENYANIGTVPYDNILKTAKYIVSRK